ncbi:hypothetical protein GJ496_008841 [Pomphorhynchus laevis]|nr:hypothetical protein GJ496_008841 [Pomphorhynchus laevis]
MEFKCLNEIEESQQRYMAHFDKKYNFECSKIFHNAFTETANVSSSEIKITDTSREPTDVDSHLTHEINDEFDSSELLDELEPIHIKLPDDDLSTVADENGGDSTDETLARTSMMLVPEDDLHKTKLELISYISASLLDKDILTDLYDRLQNVVLYDPEFILKLSLYAKNNLNIRLLGNTLLAFAIENIECRHFVDRYFNAIINVPTDLLTTLSKLWASLRHLSRLVHPRSSCLRPFSRPHRAQPRHQTSSFSAPST